MSGMTVVAALLPHDDQRRAGVDGRTVRLLAAAAEVFAERGFDGAGVAEIARRAGVTTGAIYGRYAGKADLLVAALEAHTSDEFDSLFADHSFQGRMEDIISVAGGHLVDDDESPTGSALLAEAFMAARRHPEVAALMRTHVDDRRARLATIIDLAKDGGGIDPSLDTEALVTFCHAVGFGFLLHGAIDSPMPDTTAWQHLIGHLVGALARSGPGAQDLISTPGPIHTSDPMADGPPAGAPTSRRTTPPETHPRSNDHG